MTIHQLGGLLLSGAALVLTALRPAPPTPVPPGWPAPAYQFVRNAPTPAGFALGRTLFYEPALSRDGSISCASCHTPATAFTHSDHRVSHGIEGRLGTRNAPALQNLVWNTSFHWDGGVNNLEMQAVNPLTHPAEMDFTLPAVVARLNGSRAYRARFARAFGDSTVSEARLLKALTQFTGALTSFDSKYDKYVRHEPGGELSEPELHGLALFRQHCASCHQEPLFTNNGFANNGLLPDSAFNDLGRGRLTGKAADHYTFRVPTLRNIEFTAPYMHDGRFRRLREVLQHYTSGTIRPSPTLAPPLRQPIVLPVNDQKDLLSFLFTLSDRSFLTNPAYQYQSD